MNVCLARAAPGHDWHGRDRVLRRALDHLVADREINQGIALLVHDPEDVGVLEENRGVLGVDLLVIGERPDIRRDRPDSRQEMENRLGSSARPREPPTPPVRAWLIWQATPGTFGSSKALTQTWSFRPTRRKVVLTQDMSSASAADADRPANVAAINPFIILVAPLTFNTKHVSTLPVH